MRDQNSEVHAPGDLGPPEVQAGQVADDRSADHDVVEVGDDEVGVVDVDVDAERRQEQPGQAADQEQSEEGIGVEHRRLERDRALVERRRPVERLHRRRDRHREAQEREHHRRVDRDAGDEQVVGPDQEAEHGDGQRREGDEAVAEDPLAREGRDDLADDPHRRQDHDVDRRVRVEPEQVLEQHRVAAALRVEDPEAEHALDEQHHHGDGDDRRAEHLDEAGGVVRPHEQRQLATRSAPAPACGGS